MPGAQPLHGPWPQSNPFGDGLRKAMLEAKIGRARAAHRLGREGVSFAGLEQLIHSRLYLHKVFENFLIYSKEFKEFRFTVPQNNQSLSFLS
jgi:hypothetical protein